MGKSKCASLQQAMRATSVFPNSSQLDRCFSNGMGKAVFVCVVAETWTIGLREISAALKISYKFGCCKSQFNTE